jgi:hypothetical protein
MRWSDIPFRPSSRTLRQFAGLWIVFFAGLACWEYFRHGRDAFALALLILAFCVGPIGLIKPQWLRPIFVGWMCLAFPVGWVISHVVLAFLFYGILLPLGIVFRLIGRDVLTLRRNPAQTTYWSHKNMPSDVRSYFRQS